MEPKYNEGTAVWAHVPGYPWWPGVVVNYDFDCFLPKEMSCSNGKSRSTLVMFFGHGGMSYLSPAHVMLYKNHEQYRKRKGKWSKQIKYAVRTAERHTKQVPPPIISTATVAGQNNDSQAAVVKQIPVAPVLNARTDLASKENGASAPGLRRSTRRRSFNGVDIAARAGSASNNPATVAPITVGVTHNNVIAMAVVNVDEPHSLGVSKTPISKSRRPSRGSPGGVIPLAIHTPLPADGIVTLRRSKRHSDAGAPLVANDVFSQQSNTEYDGAIGAGGTANGGGTTDANQGGGAPDAPVVVRPTGTRRSKSTR